MEKIWILLLATALEAGALQARDFSAYRVGETVEQDIVAPISFDVAAAQTISETPAIFRFFCPPTNVLAGQFEVTFDEARSNFETALVETFHHTKLDTATIASDDFGYFLTAYNIGNKKFPIPTALAADWAAGKDDQTEKEKIFFALASLMESPIRPDQLPKGFQLQDTVRLVKTASATEDLPTADLATSGQIVAATNLLTPAQAQMCLHRRLTGDGEPPLARALSVCLQPNCLPEVALTQTARAETTAKTIAAQHYATGQIIAQKNSTIDFQTKAALDQLEAKLIAAAREIPSPPKIEAAPLAKNDAPAFSAAPPSVLLATNSPPQNFTRVNWLIAFFTFIAISASAVSWQIISRHRQKNSSNNPLRPISAALQKEVAPQLLQVVRETLVQELAAQRRELLSAQKAAAVEVGQIARKTDALQSAIQERLRAYESQILNLEAELASRTAENRDLIHSRIELIRQQLAVETIGGRMEFN